MTAAEHPRVDPIEIFDALGIGWGVHELYPDPVNQQAFESAVDRLAVLRDSSITYEIGAATVSFSDEELSIERGGSARLALRLFVHDVEWLEIIGAPSAVDLDQFFKLLAADETETRESGGIASALQAVNVWSISVTQRGLLSGVLEQPWEERAQERTADDGNVAEDFARMVTTGATAVAVAEGMVELAEGDFGYIAESFGEAYRLVYGAVESTGAGEQSISELLTAYRHAPNSRPPLETFVETFFLLPLDAQVRVLSDFLASRQEGLHSLLLDQLGGSELADLAPLLDEAGFGHLLSYVREIVDNETGTADELLPMVSTAREVKVARKSAADRIRDMIEGIGGLGGATGGLAGKLRVELESTEELGLRLVRLLFEIEDRPDRFGHLVDAWCRRISSEVQAKNPEAAIVMLRAGTRDVELPAGKQRTLEAGLVELLRSDYGVFNEAAQDPENREHLGVLLGEFGEAAAVHLMERLSIEEDPSTRRVLIGLLVVVGSSHPQPIARFFTADEWYVVRNAVSIAGKVGGRMWVPHLHQLVAHSDPRVVIEALRALTPLASDEAIPDLVSSMAHANERVRQTAFLLLEASNSSAREAELTAALTDKKMDVARNEIAKLLFEVGTPTALTVLEELAKRPFFISGTRRDARRAAREVLGAAA